MSEVHEILDKPFKEFIIQNLKWCLGTAIRYGFVVLMIILVFIFIYGGIKGGKFTHGPGVVVKPGKTINISKPSDDTNEADIKDIDDSIRYLYELRAKAGKMQ